MEARRNIIEDMDEAMLRCQDIVELLDDYLDGALAPRVAAALEAHLEGCRDCTAFLRTYRGTVRATRRLKEADLPAELRDRLIGFLRQRRER